VVHTNKRVCSRAGVVPGSPLFIELLKAAFSSPAVNVYGFYAHAGNAYASTSLDEASSFLSSEVHVVNQAAELAKPFISSDDGRPPFVLSVGSTPTAHSASGEARERLKELLNGNLELHAGGYLDHPTRAQRTDRPIRKLPNARSSAVAHKPH
jgi:D-serine deaminase-like pyridoxal phosphate-dependent protein